MKSQLLHCWAARRKKSSVVVWGAKGYNMYILSSSTYLGPAKQQPHSRSCRTWDSTYLSANFTFDISTWQCPAICGEDWVNLLLRTTDGITDSLTCRFARQVSVRISRQHPANILDTLWILIQAAWRETPQEHIQALFDSIPQHLEALIAVHAGYTSYTSYSHRSCIILWF